MKSLVRLARLQLGASDIDTVLLKSGQIVCLTLAACVLAIGLPKLSSLDLSEAQFFSALLQLAQTSLLFCILGLFLHPKSKA